MSKKQQSQVYVTKTCNWLISRNGEDWIQALFSEKFNGSVRIKKFAFQKCTGLGHFFARRKYLKK